MKDPLVSVVLPVYNRPSVVNTIHSILNQDYTNFEVIVIDNCSIDSTVEKIKSIVDNRIKLFINEENKGQTYSLNRGLSLARGKYIARIDSDDLMYPNRIRKQVEFLEKNDEVVICGSDITLIDEHDNEIGKFEFGHLDESIRFESTFFCPFAHPAVMIRSDALTKNNIKYDEHYRMAEDYDLWCRLLQIGKSFNYQEPLTYYRVSQTSDSSRFHHIMKQETFKIIRRSCLLQNKSINSNCSMSKLVDMSEIQNKNVLQILYVAYYWMKYFNLNMKKSNSDYRVLKKQMISFIYSTCLIDNNKMFAKVLLFLHKKIKGWL